MSDPILSREQIIKIVEPFADEAMMKKHQDVIMRCVAELEAAVLEKVCGETIYQITFEGEEGWCDTHKKCYDCHPDHARRIVYALTRSNP